MDLKPYLTYKDSGVPWLGEVPEHWSMAPNRSLLRRRKVLVGNRHTDYALLSLTKAGLVIRDVSTGRGKFSADMGTSQEVRCGDLVFCLFDVPETPRTVGLSRHNGMITGAYSVFECDDRVLGLFLEAFYIAMDDRKALSPLYSGLRNTIPPSRFLGIKTAIPPKDGQAAIVRYLDYADRRIQRYIRAKQKLVTLLEEQKQAIIHQAVTGQIDVCTGRPYPAYKPSGVEWLGDVPKHWKVRKLRQCGSVSGGMTPSMDVRRFWGGLVPWVTPKDMKQAVISDSSVRTTNSAVQETSLRLIEPPAVLIVVRGMILARRVPIACTAAPVTINQDMKALRTVKGMNAAFLARSLDSAQEAFIPLIDEAGHGTRRLPMERWRELVITIPPEEGVVARPGANR